MPFIKTDFPGLLVFEPKVFEDSRGYFYESYNENTFAAEGVTIKFVQDNQAQSSYWMRNGDYVRLKQVEIGYSIPQNLLIRIKLQSIRVFARGYNLLTIASKEIDDRDPEIISGFSYPMQRLLNFGINIKL